jgi:hypothetical protein
MSEPKPLPDYLQEYFAATFVGRAPSYLRTARRLLAYMEEFTGKLQLDVKWYADWIAHCHSHWKPTTPKLILTHTNRILNWLEMMGYLFKSPHRVVRWPLVSRLSSKSPLRSKNTRRSRK